LQTGDQVDILTHPHGIPSRDWLNKSFGYLTTSRARSKVAYWFRQQDLNQHIESGKKIIEREFSRNGIYPNIQKLASHFNFKDEGTFLAALGRGNLRVTQVAQHIDVPTDSKQNIEPILTKKYEATRSGMSITGMHDLMTRIARCCKPIPGDKILGYITKGHGVTIHKRSCNNIAHLDLEDNDRLLQMTWDSGHKGAYYVDIQIRAHVRENLLKEVTTLLVTGKIDLVHFNSIVNKNHLLIIMITIKIHDVDQLQDLIKQVCQLQGVIEANRISH
jgi:GTP pyrophosphokinase